MKLRAWINGYTFPVVQGATFKDNFNEELDSGTIIIEKYVTNITTGNYDAANDTLGSTQYRFNDYSEITESIRNSLNLVPRIDVIIYDYEATGHREGWHRGKDDSSDTSTRYVPSYFYKHFVIENYTEDEVFLGDYGDNKTFNPGYKQYQKTYKFTLLLCSEIKKAEYIPLPNLKITQPLYLFRNNGNNVTNLILEKNSIWFYLNQYVNTYNATERIGTGIRNKYVLDKSVKDVFDKIICPEMSITGRTLREALSALMVVKDRIPYVKDDVIYCIDLANNTGAFDNTLGQVNYRRGQMSGADYIFGLRRNHTQSIAQDFSAHSVEQIGFRNSSTPLLKLDNLRVETTFPIYKINKMYMCYYKPTTDGNYYFCKQDITKLVKLGSERMALSKDWEQFADDYPENIDDLAQYKLATVEYNIGSNQITGWGEQYTFPRGWWIGKGTATYIENIITFLDSKYPKGVAGKFSDNNENNQNDLNVLPAITKNTSGLAELYSSLKNIFGQEIALFLKSVTFIIDYIPFYSGTTVVKKGFGDVDDNLMSFDSPGPLVVLEKDGLNCKEKLERLGNKTFMYSYRYISSYDNSVTAYSQLQPVGSIDNVINPGVVIFSREYSIYDNIINATYTGSKEYVLKNFFTTVYAKYRTWSLMSFSESVKRNENLSRCILISKDINISDSEDYKITNLNTSSSLNDFMFDLFSFYNQSDVPTSTIGYKDRTIFNAGYFECAYFYYTFSSNGKTSIQNQGYGKMLSDLNAFATGNSLCFNMAMTDNITGGTFIEKINPADEVDGLDDVDKEVIGSRQGQYYLIDSTENGKIENIKLGFINYDFNGLLYDEYGKETRADVKNVINPKLYHLPLLPDDANVSNNLEIDYTFNKDNGEYLDFTMQFDFVEDEDIVISPYAAKLSDSITKFYKQLDASRIIEYNSPYINPGSYAYPFAIFCTSIRTLTQIDSFPANMQRKFGLVNSVSNVGAGYTTTFKADTQYELLFPYITIAVRKDFSQLGTEFNLEGKQAEIVYKKLFRPAGTSYANPNISDISLYHIEKLTITFVKIYANESTFNFSFSSKNFAIPCIRADVNLEIKYKAGTSSGDNTKTYTNVNIPLYKVRKENGYGTLPEAANYSSDWNCTGSRNNDPADVILSGDSELDCIKKRFDSVINSDSVGYNDFSDFNFYRIMITEIFGDHYFDYGDDNQDWGNVFKIYPQTMNLVIDDDCMYDTMRSARFVANANNANLTSDETFFSITTNNGSFTRPTGWRNVKVLSDVDLSSTITFGSFSGNSFDISYSSNANEDKLCLIAPIFTNTSEASYYEINPVCIYNSNFAFRDNFFNSSRESMGVVPTVSSGSVPLLDVATVKENSDERIQIYLNGMWRLQCGREISSNPGSLSDCLNYWDDCRAIQVPFLIYNDDFSIQDNTKYTVLSQNLYYVSCTRPLLEEDIYKEFTQEEFELLIGHTLGANFNYNSGIVISRSDNTFSFNQSGEIAIFYRVDSNCGKVDDIGIITRGNYVLVFAVNGYEANTPIYLSYLSKRDTRIFDENHKLIKHLGDPD